MNQLKVNFFNYFLVICSSTLLFFANIAYALPDDKKQTMHVEADSADLNQQQHQGIYIGHVEFTQGTTNLHAAHAITKANEQNKLMLAIAKGNKESQAHYWTLSSEDKPPFHAYADTIKYYPLKHLIELTGHARVEQGTNSLAAEKIIYDTLKQHVVTEGTPTNRTVIIFYPEKKTS